MRLAPRSASCVDPRGAGKASMRVGIAQSGPQRRRPCGPGRSAAVRVLSNPVHLDTFCRSTPTRTMVCGGALVVGAATPA